ncbi:hypothetical protein ILUMI_05999, partial [Ignelater luminosus]
MIYTDEESFLKLSSRNHDLKSSKEKRRQNSEPRIKLTMVFRSKPIESKELIQDLLVM